MITFTSAAQIEEAPTKDLIAFYNQHSTKPVKKFSDRQTAVQRCKDLFDECGMGEQAESEDQDDQEDPNSKLAAEEAAAQLAEADKNFVWPFKAGEQTAAASEDKPEGEVKVKTKTVTKKPISHASNAAGVAASWADPSVAAARLTRNGVRVTVKDDVREFKSTREAFRALRLMDSKHIRFRGILKAANVATYTENGVDYLFEIV